MSLIRGLGCQGIRGVSFLRHCLDFRPAVSETHLTTSHTLGQSQSLDPGQIAQSVLVANNNHTCHLARFPILT